MSEVSEKAIKLINDLRRDISIDIMFTPEKNAEDDSLKALVDYIAELEGENKKAFDFVKTLRTYCIYAHWDNPDTEGEFNEFDAEICKWLSEFTEREE